MSASMGIYDTAVNEAIISFVKQHVDDVLAIKDVLDAHTTYEQVESEPDEVKHGL